MPAGLSMLVFTAVCVLEGHNHVRGTVYFATSGENTIVAGQVRGLQPNMRHGFHIHEFGDYSSGCTSTGSHFDTSGNNHGGPGAEERHTGDLGNIEADVNGVATIYITDSQIQLTGPNSIIGRSVVIHADEDDLGLGGHTDSLTTGHAGGRLACGVIGHKKP